MPQDRSHVEIIVVHSFSIAGIKDRDSVTLQGLNVFLQSIGTHVGEHHMIMAIQKKKELKQASSSGGAVLGGDDVVDDEDLLPWSDRNGLPKVLLLSLQWLRPFFHELRSVGFHSVESC